MKGTKLFGRRALLAGLLLAAALALSGCDFNLNYVVLNARVAEVATILKEYVNYSGYTITYANDASGEYRVVVGKAVLPAPPAEKYRRMIIEHQYSVLIIKMNQQGGDVFINARSAGRVDASLQYEGFIDYLKNKGYAIQEIK